MKSFIPSANKGLCSDMILISCELNDFCSKVTKTYSFHLLIHQLVTLWKREEKSC